MKKGFLYSILFHIVLVSLVFLKIPHTKNTVINPSPIKVDIVSEITKIKKSVQKVETLPKVEEVKEEEKVEKPEPKPKPVEKKPEPVVKKAPSKEELKKRKLEAEKKIEAEKKRESEKKLAEEKKKQEAERKKKEDLFKSVLSDLQDLGDANSSETETSAPPLSYSELSEIKYQIQRCWQIPPSVTKTNEEVVLQIKLNKDGSLIEAKIIDSARYNANQPMKLLAESALRAVEKCSPLQNLPVEKYASWKEIELGFNPQEQNY